MSEKSEIEEGHGPSAKAFRVPRAYLETVLLIPPQSPLSVVTGTATFVSTSTAAMKSNALRQCSPSSLVDQGWPKDCWNLRVALTSINQQACEDRQPWPAYLRAVTIPGKSPRSLMKGVSKPRDFSVFI